MASTDYPVLITGETGTGKELVATALHRASARSGAAFIRVNCAALPESLAESELFGHRRGAFSGAERDRPGKFVVADGGTLFLDEIGELPLNLQAKLLRVLQDGEIQRVGDDQTRKVDMRLLTATNRDLKAEVKAGRFREDLYHRLAVYPIKVPALRERKSDIPLLIGHFCERIRRRHGLKEVRFDPQLRDRMQAAAWPGNVRELENTVSRLVLRSTTTLVPGSKVVVQDSSSLSFEPPEVGSEPHAGSGTTTGLGFREAVREFERRLITRAVEAHGGNWSAAARALRLDRSNLHNLATRLGLKEGRRKQVRRSV